MNLEREMREDALIIGQDRGIVRTDYNHEIVADGDVVLHQAERLSEKSLDAVAFDGGADPAGDGDAQARVREMVGDCV